LRIYSELFFISGLFALLVTPFVQSLGRRLGAFGVPGEDRVKPNTPRLGGLAIYFSALAAWGVLLLVPNQTRESSFAHIPAFLRLIVPATLVLILGVYDDLVGASPRQKLIGQALAAAMVWWAGVQITQFPFFGYEIHSRAISFVLTVLWIVAVTNSFNLIDGMDGLAAGVGFFVGLTIFVISLIQGNRFAAIIAAALAGGLAGFLPFNFDPAKIYLGDTGSLFLGFIFSVLAVDTSQKSTTMVAIVVPYMAFGLPLLDTLLTIIRRFLSGKPLFAADTDHIHHRIFQKYEGTRPALFALYSMAAIFSLGSLLMARSVGSAAALIAVLGGICAWFVASQLQYAELTELNCYVSRAFRSQRQVLANQVRLRKAAARLEQIDKIGESWQVVVQTLEALDFDGLELSALAQNGSALKLPPWQRSPNGKTTLCWSVVIPLHNNGTPLAELRLRRALAKGRLLFQFSSLLDTLIPPFEQKLALWHASKGPNPLDAFSNESPAVKETDLVAKGNQHEATLAGFENA